MPLPTPGDIPNPGTEPSSPALQVNSFFFFNFTFFFFFVVNFVIHWNEKALCSQVFPIPIPPPTSLPTHSLQVLPEHQVRALVSCIQPGPVICFTIDSIHVSMLFYCWATGEAPYFSAHSLERFSASPALSRGLFTTAPLGRTINVPN